MNKLITTCLIVFFSLSLAGCQTMSNQDVGVLSGGIAGGVLGSTVGRGNGQLLAIAAGTIAGAAIGGSIGRNMDDNDRIRFNHALDDNRLGQPAYWHNDRYDADYEIVPTRNVAIRGNEYCREYRTVAVINGKRRHMYGSACRQPDGSWQAVS